jgi:hypothetical protein
MCFPTFHHAISSHLGICAAACGKTDLRFSASMMLEKEEILQRERRSVIIKRAIDLSIHQAFHSSSDRMSLSIFMQRSQKRLSQTFATIRSHCSHGKEIAKSRRCGIGEIAIGENAV